jgi:hypothetical protein
MQKKNVLHNATGVHLRSEINFWAHPSIKLDKTIGIHNVHVTT